MLLAEPDENAAEEHVDVVSKAAGIEMRLVQDNGPELSRLENGFVCLAQHHVFQHGKVGDQDVADTGRIAKSFAAPDQMVEPAIPFGFVTAAPHGPGLVVRVARGGCLAGVHPDAEHRTLGLADQLVNALELVLHQRVHGIHQQDSDAGLLQLVFRLVGE